ncbi:putative integral membrane protein [Janibacter sp. HTCC2649]|uniref:M50 family metallopeptidase n=1 Tax=Janibacter sp. HTCC2649 TaxID=313589 RepID=UPI0000671AD0|nr:M50 family metallopeptidase [Janibacter sp. HTCC2649]EAP97816.1 putative integral membrane protein [Janibacter sp. HTCC2649]
MDVGTELSTRLGSAAPGLNAGALATAALAALAVVLVPTIWLQLRIAVTLVHELGHAIIGIAFGRRFTGFVVRGDMSGHAVTVGPARGIGRIATTWAGYPMPALVGLLMVWSATTGYAAALLFACLLTLVVVLAFVRSAGTLATVAAAGVGIGALWWWRNDEVQALAVVSTGLVLLIGAWRHLGALTSAHGRRDRGSDAAVLRQLTGIPAFVWIGTFVAVLALATWEAARLLLALS